MTIASICFLVLMYNQGCGFCSYLKKSLFHLWIDTLCTLLIATNDAGVRSSDKPQGLHKWTDRLRQKR